VVSLVTGSVLLSLLWLGDGNVSLFDFIKVTTSGSEGKSLATIVLLMLTLGCVWLLSTVALLLARQWVAAGLALPTALVVYIGLALLLAVPVPSLVIVGLLLLLNSGALWLAWRFLTSPYRG
jgi:mannose/fructose/N-acetylgalactosamine-specific phosphotransferase system component IIC